MNRLVAMVDGQEVACCWIHTGSKYWCARRVPRLFAQRALTQGWSLMVETARGPKARRIVERAGHYYTREVA
jgi:hypothetical protein